MKIRSKYIYKYIERDMLIERRSVKAGNQLSNRSFNFRQVTQIYTLTLMGSHAAREHN